MHFLVSAIAVAYLQSFFLFLRVFVCEVRLFDAIECHRVDKDSQHTFIVQVCGYAGWLSRKAQGKAQVLMDLMDAAS